MTSELSLSQVFLTHGHGDHGVELDRLIEKNGAPAWTGEREAVAGAENFSAGREFALGSLRIETRSTWGHAVGGGDHLRDPWLGMNGCHRRGCPLCGINGRMISCEACLSTNRKEIFSLPADTLLCPGHGPLTTMELERVHNPFFAED